MANKIKTADPKAIAAWLKANPAPPEFKKNAKPSTARIQAKGTATAKNPSLVESASNAAQPVGALVPAPVRQATKRAAKGGLKVVGTVGDYATRPLKAAAVQLTDPVDLALEKAGFNNGEGLRKDITPLQVLKKGAGFDKVSGIDATKIKNPILRTGAYAFNAGGEIATDPTTYLTGGVGAISKSEKVLDAASAISKAESALSAAKVAGDVVAKRAAKASLKDAKVVAKVAKSEVKDVGRKDIARRLIEAGNKDAADRVLTKGWQAATDAELASVGLKAGIKIRATGKTLGGARTAKVVRAGRAISPAKGALAAREGLVGTSGGNAVSEGLEKIRGARSVERNRGAASRLQFEDTELTSRRAGSAKAAEWGRDVKATVDTKAIRTADRNGDLTDALEGVASPAVVARLNTEFPGLIDSVRATYDEGGRRLTALAGPVPMLPNYTRRVLTRKASSAIAKFNDAEKQALFGATKPEAISATLRKRKAGDIFLGETLQSASTREMNDIFRRKTGVDLFETDALAGLNDYGKQLGDAAYAARRTDELQRAGLGTFDKKVIDPKKVAEKSQALANAADAADQVGRAKLAAEAAQRDAAIAPLGQFVGKTFKRSAVGLERTGKALLKETDAKIAPRLGATAERSAAELEAKAAAAARDLGTNTPLADTVAADVANTVATKARTRAEVLAKRADAAEANRDLLTAKVEMNAKKPLRTAKAKGDHEILLKRLEVADRRAAAHRATADAAAAEVTRLESNQASKALSRQQALAQRAESLASKAEEARSKIDTVKGRVAEHETWKATRYEQAADLQKQAQQVAATGDKWNADALDLLSKAKETQADLAAKTKNWDSAYKAYGKLDTESWLSVLDGAKNKYLKAYGNDFLTDPDITRALQAIDELRFQKPNVLLRQFDKVMGVWKAQQLLTPGYHVRNFLGGLFNNQLAGVDSSMYRVFMRNNLRFRQGGLEAIPNPTIREAFAEMINRGAIKVGDTNLMTGEIVNDLGGLGSKANEWGNPFSPNWKPFKGNRLAGDGVENHLRGTLFLDQFIKNGNDADEAFFKTIRFHYDGENLSQFEQKYGRRLMSFFTFTRNNMPLQLEQMLAQPGAYTAFGHVQSAFDQGRGDALPQWYDWQIQSPVDIGGSPTYFAPDMMNAQLFDFAENPKKFVMQGSNPAIQEMLSRMTGTSLSSGTRYDNMGKYRYVDPKGITGALAKAIPGMVNDGQVDRQNVDALKRLVPFLKFDATVGNVQDGPEGEYKQLQNIISQVAGVTPYVNTPNKQKANALSAIKSQSKKKSKSQSGSGADPAALKAWLEANPWKP